MTNRHLAENYPATSPIWTTPEPVVYRMGQNAEGDYIFLDKPVDIDGLQVGDVVPPLIHHTKVPENEAAKKLVVVK